MRVAADRILIVLLGAIGDVVRALPLAHARARRLPAARTSRGRSSRARRRFSRSIPALDERLVFERRGGVRAFVRSCAASATARFDLVARSAAPRQERPRELRRRAPRSASASIAGTPRSSTGSGTPTRSIRSSRAAGSSSSTSASRDFLELPAHAAALRRHARPPRRRRASPSSLAPLARPFAALFLGSTWESRLWFAEDYAARRRRARRARPRRGAGRRRGRPALAAATMRASARPPLDLTARTTLRESYGVLARARVAIGPDSGPMHLAAAGGHAGRVALGRDDAGALGAVRLATTSCSSDACRARRAISAAVRSAASACRTSRRRASWRR